MRIMNKKDILLLKRFLKFLYPYRMKGIIAFFFMMLAVLLQLPMPFLTKYLVDKVLVMKSFRILNMIGFVLVGVLLIRIGAVFLERYFLATFRGRVLFDLRMAVFNRTERLKLSFLKGKETGYLMSRLSGDVSSVQGLFADTIVSLVQNIMVFIVGVVATIYIHPKLALISFSILPFYAISVWIFNKRIRDMSYELRENFADINKDLQELLSGLTVIKAFTGEVYGSLKLIRSLKRGIKKSVKLDIISTLFSLLSSFISSIAPLILIWYGSGEIMRGHLTLGGLMAFSSFIGYLFDPTESFMGINLTIQKSLASAERIFEIMDKTEEAKEKGSIDLELPIRNIKFENVLFSYDKENILEDISFEIKSGENVAFVGETGVGKSTIAALLLGFYEPDEGTIYINDIDTKKLKLSSIRKNIAYVSQDIFLFSDTIRENIRFGRRGASDNEVEKAARSAGIHDFIEKLPDGYDTKTGERGLKLSGGERQRISIARAILKNAPILLLDEATSNLDRKTERRIIEAIKRVSKYKILITIAHRLSTIKDADRIFVLNNGRIIASGRHNELMRESEIYRKLYMK